MSAFRYNSNHKAITALLIIAVAVASFYLGRRGAPTYANGQAKREGGTVDGRNNGRWTWYYPGGQKKMEGFFDRGKRTGRWLTFAANGDTITEAFYANDKLNGTYTVFGTNGQPNKVVLYSNDQQVDPAATEEH